MSGVGLRLFALATSLVLLTFSPSFVDDVSRIAAAPAAVAVFSVIASVPVCPAAPGSAVDRLGARAVRPIADGRSLLLLLDGGGGDHVADLRYGLVGRVSFTEHGDEGINEHLGCDKVLLGVLKMSVRG